MTYHTAYAYLTDAEISTFVRNKKDATEMEVVLAQSIERLLDTLEGSEGEVQRLLNLLEEHGVSA